MKILQLRSENVKRLKAVEIRPDGTLVVLKGNNGQGKSSVLDSILYALGGKGAQPAKPIRRGESKARVELDLDDLVVERRWTSDEKTYLEVRSKDGAKFPSPQAILDKLIGGLSFDPLAFLRYDPRKQLGMLRELVQLDLSDLDAEQRKAYEERTLVNREAERLKAQVPAPVEGEVPEAEVSLEQLLAEQSKAQEQKAANDAKRAEVSKLREEHKAAQAQIAKVEADLAEAEAEVVKKRNDLAEAKKHLDDLTAAGKALGTAVKALKDPDLAGLTARAKTLEATNAKVRQKRARIETLKAAEAKQAESEALTKKLEEIAKARTERIGAAKFPVEGLGFGADGITYNDLPFEQASSAEQLRVSLAMGLALHPKLRVVLIRDGSLLDEKSLAMVAEQAAKADAQVWLEVVGKDGGPAGVVIEDGLVEGAPVPVASEPPVVESAPSPDPDAPTTAAPEPVPASANPIEDSCPF